MKLLVVMIVCLSTLVTEAFADENCEAVAGLSAEEKFDLENSDIDDATYRMKCFLSCMLEKTGIVKGNAFTEDALFYAQLVHHYQETSDKLKGLKKCINSDIQETDACEFAFQFTRCVVRSSPGLFAYKTFNLNER